MADTNAAPGPPQGEAEDKTTTIAFEKLMTDIQYQILNKMDIDTVNQMRHTSKSVNDYVNSVAPGLSFMKNAEHLFYTKRGLRWQYVRLKKILHGSCPLLEMTRRLHGVKVKCMLIEVALDESLVQCISKSRIRVNNLTLGVESDIRLVNELIAAVRPGSFNYDVSIHDDTKQHYTDDGKLPGTSLDITDLVIPSYMHTLKLRAETFIGFDIGAIPRNVKTLETNAPVRESEANDMLKAWQRSGRNISKYVLTGAVCDLADNDFSIDKALDRTDPKTLYPQFMLNDRPPSFVVDRGEDQSLVVILGQLSRLVVVGPGNPANQLYKDQRTPGN